MAETGEKPFHCKICVFIFEQNECLKTHGSGRLSKLLTKIKSCQENSRQTRQPAAYLLGFEGHGCHIGTQFFTM